MIVTGVYSSPLVVLQKFYSDEYREANAHESESIQKLRQATKLQVHQIHKKTASFLFSQ